MDKKEFIERVTAQIALAEKDKSNANNVLDMRVFRPPYAVGDDAIFSVSELDDAYEFIKGYPIWHLDIYENIAGENMAVYLDHSVIAMPAY